MGQSKVTIGSVLEKTSPRDQLALDIQSNRLIYNVFGFIPGTDYTDNAVLLSNLGYILSQQNFNVCLLDFKVFSPNLYLFLDVPQKKRGSGLLMTLKDEKVDMREEIDQTKHNRLYLLTPSPHDLMEEYFDFSIETVSRVIETLKKLFDIVLIDIPYNPSLEFCLGAMKSSHLGFFTASERIDALSNLTRLLDFARSIGISAGKFANVIFMNLQNLKYDFSFLKKQGFEITAGLPLVKGAVADALEGKLYLKDNNIINNLFKKEMLGIVNRLLAEA